MAAVWLRKKTEPGGKFFLPPMSPKITLEREKKEKMETARRKKGGEENKQWLHS